MYYIYGWVLHLALVCITFTVGITFSVVIAFSGDTVMQCFQLDILVILTYQSRQLCTSQCESHPGNVENAGKLVGKNAYDCHKCPGYRLQIRFTTLVREILNRPRDVRRVQWP